MLIDKELKMNFSRIFLWAAGLCALPAVVAGAEVVTIPVADARGLQAAAKEVRRIRAADRDTAVEVVLAAGDYDLPDGLRFDEGRDGFRSSETAALTFRAAPGARARICGGTVVKGWTKTSFNGRTDVWTADVSALKLKAQLKLFYMDGVSKTLCRWPNYDPAHPFSGGWAYVDGKPQSMYRPIEGERDDEFKVKPADVRPWSHPEEGSVNIFPRYNWWNAYRALASFDVSNRVFRLAKRIGEGFAPRAQDRYHLMGLREELDAPGEWYHDLAGGRIYYIPDDGRDPNQVRTAVLRDGRAVFTFAGVTNVTVRGLEICEAAACVNCDHSRRVRVVACRLHDVGFFDGAAVALNGTLNEVRDCDIWNTGTYGVAIGNDWSVKYAPETRDGNVVENNYIHHCGRHNRHGFGVTVRGQGSRVARNLIHDMPRGGIFYSGRFLTIEKNRIRHVNLEMEDTAAIYGGGYLNNTGTKINGNWVSDSIGFSHDAKGVYAFRKTCAWGIYLDDCSGGAEVVGNLVEHCNGGGMHMHCARFNVVSNNVFVSNGGLSKLPRQHSIRGWKITELNPYMKGRAQKGYEAMVAFAPSWTNYMTLAHPPAAPDAPGGLIMQGNRLVNNVWYYPDQTNSCVYRPGNYNPSNNVFDANIIWDGTPEPKFQHEGKDVSLAEWRARGQDVHSICRDPCFRDPAHGDWSYHEGSPAPELGIWPVKPAEAGLYLNENRRTFPREAEGVREHPQWIQN